MNSNYKPNLSVIIPAYNENGTIDKLLDVSLDLARDNNWEIIVVDDGSTDGIAESVQQRADSKNCRTGREIQSLFFREESRFRSWAVTLFYNR